MTRWALLRSAMLATTALAPFAAAPAFANPQGPNVVGGAATVSGVGTSSVTVNQATPRAIINWNTFNIGAGERTQFVQPDASSVALNRVTGGLGPSQLYGSLTANGRVFVVNPDGIMIGRGATINTGGFLASTHDITNENFMAGRYHFNIPGRPDASVVNEGRITAHSHGFAALVAPGVRNSGTITAKFGKIGLAAAGDKGFSLDLYGDQLITLAIGDSIAATVKDVATGQPLSALVKNEGKLKAAGGRIELTASSARTVVDSVINNSGVIEARSVGQRNGKIVLGGPTAATKVAGAPTQTVKVSGTLLTASRRGKGGTIQVTGEAIEIKAATFDASGATGGGKVLIGGDTGGGNPMSILAGIPQAGLEAGPISNATTVTIDAATTINASATSVGDGGKIIIWSDGGTSFAGKILGRGGENGGNGGFAEVSGKVTLGYFGTADMRAPHGTFGTLLLDPYSITITTAPTTGGPFGGGTFAPNATSNLNNVELANALLLASVIVTTGGLGSAGGDTGDITVSAPVVWNTNSTLTLAAYNDIIINDTGVAGTIRNESSAQGHLVLYAGMGTIGGTVVMPISTNPTRVDWTGSTGSVTVYYNPIAFGTQDVFTVGNGRFDLASASQLTQYMLVHSFANLAAIGTNATTLGEKYALGRNISGPFTGIPGTFTGVFEGLNNTLSGTLTGPAVFGVNSGIIRNLNLQNVTVTAGANDARIGVLAGTNNGAIENVHVLGGSVSGGAFTGISAGGLVGWNEGSILNSTSSATVGGSGLGSSFGGLVGVNGNIGLISNSSASGNVSATASVPPVDCNGSPTCPNVFAGGLVGMNNGDISGDSQYAVFATGNVNVGSNGVGGGLVGFNGGWIYNAMASGNVTGAAGVPGTSNQFDRATIIGGLIGTNNGLVWESKATGTVGTPGVDYLRAGGFVGDNTGLIGTSRAEGNVFAGNYAEAGGFVGAGGGDSCMFFCAIGNSVATGNVTVGAWGLAGGFAGSGSFMGDVIASGAVTGGANSILGGFVGVNNLAGWIYLASASGPVTSTGSNSWVGGFVGYNGGIILESTASGAVTGTSDSILGGFAAVNIGWIDPSSASGAVNGPGANNILGGFAGLNLGSIDYATSTGAVTGGANNIVGGLVGANASFANYPAGSVLLSSFPTGVVNNSSASGTASGGPGSIIGQQIGTGNPSKLPTTPQVIANCNEFMCTIFKDGVLGAASGESTLIPDEVLAVPNLIQALERLERFQPTEALIRIIPAALTTPGQPGGGRVSQVPGTPPRSLAPPPAYIRTNGLPSGLPPLNETRFNATQVLVRFPTNVSQAEWNAIAQQFGLTIVSSQTTAGGVSVQFQLGGSQDVRNMIRAMEQLRNLGEVQPNYTYSLVQAQQGQAPAAAAAPIAATAMRGDPAQYMTGKLHLDEAHRVSSGNNVPVAVIDSEVDPDHAELAGRFVGRFDATQSEARPHSHGTAMAGAIVSRDRLLGVAPNARIMAVRAFSETQTTAESTTFTILKGIDWAVSQGARVINMSFAGPYDPSLERALKDAADKGVILIAASGNAGPKSPPLWPGADPNVIAVTATDSGDKVFARANRGPYVSVASPGVEILAPAPQAGYQMSTGTSIATAHVSGVVALMLERDPTLTPRDVRLILESTATDLGSKGRDTQYGWGLVNAARALSMVDERLRKKTSDAPPATQQR